MMHFSDNDERDRLKSISEGVRRGLARDVPEQLSSPMQQLLQVLRELQQPVRDDKGQASASR
jgi:hypothetical protein